VLPYREHFIGLWNYLHLKIFLSMVICIIYQSDNIVMNQMDKNHQMHMFINVLTNFTSRAVVTDKCFKLLFDTRQFSLKQVDGTV